MSPVEQIQEFFNRYKSRSELNNWITRVQMFKSGHNAKHFPKSLCGFTFPSATLEGPVDLHPLKPLDIFKLLNMRPTKWVQKDTQRDFDLHSHNY